jgi:hypothetical protein
MVARDGTRTPAVTQQQQQAMRDPMGTQYMKAGAPAPRMPSNVAQGSVNPMGGQVRLNSPEYDFALGPKPQTSPALAAIDQAATPLMVAMPRRRPANAPSPMINLSFSPSQVGGQNMANSAGRPVAGPSGKTYYPTNQATDKIRAPMSPVAERATQKPTGLFGGLFGGTGGLFGGGMFGGGQQAPRNAAGLPIAAASGPVINGATYGITATGSVGDYGSSPGQITAGLQPGERKYDASTNSWGLR